VEEKEEKGPWRNYRKKRKAGPQENRLQSLPPHDKSSESRRKTPKETKKGKKLHKHLSRKREPEVGEKGGNGPKEKGTGAKKKRL